MFRIATRLVRSRPTQAIRLMSKAPSGKPVTSGYLLFVSENMVGRCPEGVRNVDRMREVADKWAALSDGQREDYRSRVKKMHEDHRRQIEDYLNTKPLPPPRKSTSSFTLFCTNVVPKLHAKGMKATEAVVEASKMWKELSEDEKRAYQEEGRRQRENYVSAINAWKEKNSGIWEQYSAIKDENRPLQLAEFYKLAKTRRRKFSQGMPNDFSKLSPEEKETARKYKDIENNRREKALKRALEEVDLLWLHGRI